jgi:hypothetical protein
MVILEEKPQDLESDGIVNPLVYLFSDAVFVSLSTLILLSKSRAWRSDHPGGSGKQYLRGSVA